MYVISGATISDNHNYFSRSCTSTSAKKSSVRVTEGSACSCARPWIVNGSIEIGEQLRITPVSEMFQCTVSRSWDT